MMAGFNEEAPHQPAARATARRRQVAPLKNKQQLIKALQGRRRGTGQEGQTGNSRGCQAGSEEDCLTTKLTDGYGAVWNNGQVQRLVGRSFLTSGT